MQWGSCWTRLYRDEPERISRRPSYVIPDIVETGIAITARGKYRTSNKKPLGCVVHYTAGHFERGEKSAIQTLNGLASDGLGCLVMDADGVIYKGKQEWDDVAYHAGKSEWKGKSGISFYCMGMEICNAGKLTKHGDTFRSWWGMPIPPDQVRTVNNRDNMVEGYYHKYTEAQERSLINFLLWQMDVNNLQTEWIVGHDEISPGRKFDPGGSLSVGMPKFRQLLKDHI